MGCTYSSTIAGETRTGALETEKQYQMDHGPDIAQCFFFFFALYYDLSFNDPAVGESAVCVKKKHNTVSVAFFLIYLTTHE